MEGWGGPALHARGRLRRGQALPRAALGRAHEPGDAPLAWAEDRLGPERIRGAYAWRTLREHGAHLTFNSDLPGSDWNIFYGLHAGITRRDRDREPPAGWYPEEALTSEETVRAYTSWTPRAAFLEDRTGVIEAGRWADLTVMDVDPFQLGETSPGEILDGRVLATIVAGRVVWVDER